MDRASYTHGGSSGGYAVIDTSFPARAGDKARLTSGEFQSTGKIEFLFHTSPYKKGMLH